MPEATIDQNQKWADMKEFLKQLCQKLKGNRLNLATQAEILEKVADILRPNLDRMPMPTLAQMPFCFDSGFGLIPSAFKEFPNDLSVTLKEMRGFFFWSSNFHLPAVGSGLGEIRFLQLTSKGAWLPWHLATNLHRASQDRLIELPALAEGHSKLIITIIPGPLKHSLGMLRGLTCLHVIEHLLTELERWRDDLVRRQSEVDKMLGRFASLEYLVSTSFNWPKKVGRD